MTSELSKIVGKELMLLRRDKNLSNNELSEKSKVASSTISRYEQGKNRMNLDTIVKLTTACDTDICIFFENCIAKLQQEKEKILYLKK